MPLVAAAVCPHPPLLVPEVAAGAAAELDDLRAACRAAVRALVEARPDTIVVVGGGPATGRIEPPFRASFAPWGLPRSIGHEGPGLPLSLAVGVWLLATAPGGIPGTTVLDAVGADRPTPECAALGARLAGSPARVAMLVMGDGSACREIGSPGFADPRALPYDEAVARALDSADTTALLALDPALSDQLLVAGRAAWQVLAGAVAAAGGDWRGQLRYHAAPYGVGYFVAVWRPA